SPVATVVAVGAVVAHRKVAIRWNYERLTRTGQVLSPGKVAFVAIFPGHDPVKTEPLGDLFPGLVRRFYIQLRGINPQSVAWRSSQPFDVKWRAGLRILGDPWN